MLTTHISQFVDAKSGEFLTVYNPHTDELVSDKIHAAGEADVDAAVSAAQKAFKKWGQSDPSERAALMLKFAALMREHAAEIAKLETTTMGSAIGTQTMGNVLPVAWELHPC